MKEVGVSVVGCSNDSFESLAALLFTEFRLYVVVFFAIFITLPLLLLIVANYCKNKVSQKSVSL